MRSRAGRGTAEGRRGRAWLGLAAALLCLAPSAALAAPERFALLVGADVGRPGEARLLYAESDAERVAAVFRELGSVPERNVRLLRSPTRAQLDAALARLRDDVARARRPVTLLFYYSGHAGRDALHLGRQALPFSELRAALAGTGAEVRVLFLDTCHAGAATRTKGASRAPGFLDAPTLASARGEVVITSSAADEVSQESDEVGGAWFTHYLLSALRGAADASGEGRITLEEAYRYVYHRTVSRTAATRAGAQHPGFDYDLSGSGDIVLTEKGARGAALSFDARQSGHFLIFDDTRKQFLAEVQVMPGRPSRLMVESGRYRVQVRGEDALYEQVVALGAGDEGAVDRARMTRVPYREDATRGAVALRRRLAGAPGIEVAAKAGAQAFLDPAVRAELIPPMPLWGLEIQARSLLGPDASLRFELLVGTRRAESTPEGLAVPVRFTEVHAGFGPYWTPRVPGARWLRPFVGLRVGVIAMHREFLPPLVQDSQDYVMVSPGLAAGFGFRLDPRATLTLEGRLHLLAYVDGGEQRVLAHVEPLAGVQVAF
ncbi:caspase family protein [Myxococcota bacterium]|nr:caspase family protein [Myxococcota bacterium]